MDEPVDLGLGGSRGFASADLTSPERAAAADALDVVPDPGATFTELRVHGVGGSTGPAMLEHPDALQVGGDRTTMFYRRWFPEGPGRPSVPWRLEAYSWGGLTERPLSSAAWVLLFPFMLYNVAHFALLPSADRQPEDGASRVSRDGPHAVAAAVLRLLAAAATVQFILAPVVVLVDGLAWQGPAITVRSWLAWLPALPPGVRLALALAGVAVVLVVLGVASVRTAVKYEQRTTTGTRDEVAAAGTDATAVLTLSQPRFWNGGEVVRRQRSLHVAAALASVALIVARPSLDDPNPARTTVAVLAALCLLAVLAVLCTPSADRHHLTLQAHEAPPTGGRIASGLLVLAAVTYVAAAATAGWPPTIPAVHPTLPLLTGFGLALLAVQGVLVVVLAGAVGLISRRVPRAPGPDALPGPFARGQLTTLAVALAVCAGAALTALVCLLANQLLIAAPSGAPTAQEVPITLPWPVAGGALVPIGVLVGLVVAGVVAGRAWCRDARAFDRPVDGSSPVGRYYGSAGAGTPYADDGAHDRARWQVARAWATGLLVDRTGMLLGCVALGAVAGLVLGVAGHRLGAGSGVLASLGGLESLIGVALGGALVGLLRAALRDPARRRAIGAIWDVGTFWPRACHPLAPPCYAERAVPELVDRVRLLTGTVAPPGPGSPPDTAGAQIVDHDRDAASAPRRLLVPSGPALLTGYSQGAVITPAVVALLPHDTRDRTSLLTLASPARRLYGRAFPAYFGPDQLDLLRSLLTTDGGTRWKNLVRRSDYIGSWLFHDLAPGPGPAWTSGTTGIDLPSWDPVVVALDADQAPPPIHRHTEFWPDARVPDLARDLMGSTSVGQARSGTEQGSR